jgi:hypothetical protein
METFFELPRVVALSKVQIFVIRRALVIPLGLLICLTVALLVVCISQNQPVAKAIILACMIVPISVLFVETAFRRLVIDQEGVTALRPFRQRRINFADVTSLETVRVRSRVFMTLAAGEDDFLIISNSYAAFPTLVKSLAAAVPEGTLTDDTEQQVQQPTVRHADIVTAWVAVVVVVYVLIAQFRT